MQMTEERMQEIKDKVDEAKLEVGSREYPSLSWLGWVVAYVPELIAAVEQTQAELKDVWNKIVDLRVERIALDHGAAHVESELTKQLAECRAEVERFSDDEAQSAKVFGKLVNENAKLKAENKAIEEHIAEHGA